MSSKPLIWVGMIIGSGIGSMIPLLWGDDFLSIASILLTAVGGIFGIWLGYRLSDY